MNGASGPASGTARSVLREIDQELGRLTRWETAAASERAVLLSARAALADKAGRGTRQPRVSKGDVAAYLAKNPGSSPAEIALALGVPATNVSSHLYRGRHTRYEHRGDAWYLRTP
jgi:hypothetical protein